MLASRKEIREQFAILWSKAKSGGILNSGELRIVSVIKDHPEYQPIVESIWSISEADFSSSAGQENPFLHMGLHIAIREQIALNQPPEVASAFMQLAKHRGRHAAEHALMQCLAETLWQSEQAGTPLDEASYIDKVRSLMKP